MRTTIGTGNLAETEALLPLVQQFATMARAFRDMVRRAIRPEDTVSEPAWRQAELIDVYQSEVQRDLGRSEEDLWEGGAERDDDPLDRFADHCGRAFRSGLTEAQCARRWRCRSG